MTPHKRAEKVVLRYNESDSPKLADLIASAIEEARAEALEEAAKICGDEDWSCPDCHGALFREKATQIRALIK